MKVKDQKSKRLTKKQGAILAYIRACVRNGALPPTHDEIRREFGLKSTYGVRQHLRLIQDKGYIDLLTGKSRGIRMLSTAPSYAQQGALEIPVVGRIAAGQPTLAEEHFEEQIIISDTLFPRGRLFALHVHGQSMVKAGIIDGDLAIIRQQTKLDNGEIAAVLIGEEATLKRVYAEAEKIRLMAENDTFPDIVITRESGASVRILGRYVGLVRRAR